LLADGTQFLQTTYIGLRRNGDCIQCIIS
jgi:hypothetical protein